MLNNEREFLQCKSGDLVYLISPFTLQLITSDRKVSVKDVGPAVRHMIIDPKSFLQCILDGKLSLCLFEHERLKPAIIRTSQGNITQLPQLKHYFVCRYHT